MTVSSQYLKNEVAPEDFYIKGTKWTFVGIDLAPIDTLETGIAVMDRKKNLLRMDKLNDDAELLSFLKNLGPKDSLIVALDIPKSLNIPNRWRQQEIKMHPLRLDTEHRKDTTDRFAQRAWNFYEAVSKEGILIVNYFTHHAKMSYQLNTPFRNRTPAGCKALQALIRERLGIKGLSTNLAASSVLDAMIGAYGAWSLYQGKNGQHYKLYQGQDERLYLDPLSVLVAQRKRRVRR